MCKEHKEIYKNQFMSDIGTHYYQTYNKTRKGRDFILKPVKKKKNGDK